MARYIDATALSKAVFESMKQNPHTDSIVRRTHHHEHEQFLRMINNVPTADVSEVKHGEWVDIHTTLMCSECGIIRAKNTTGVYNYCPACGSKMNKEGATNE